MTQVTITRCSESPAILTFTEDLTATLLGQDVRVEVEDGLRGQFIVVIDGQTIYAKVGKFLPAVAEIGAAVIEAGTIGLAI